MGARYVIRLMFEWKRQMPSWRDDELMRHGSCRASFRGRRVVWSGVLIVAATVKDKGGAAHLGRRRPLLTSTALLQLDRHRLRLGVVLQRRLAVLAALAGHLEPAER